MLTSFFINNFLIYLIVISLISYLLTLLPENRFKRQKKILMVGWVVFVGWFTRKMHIDSYVPSLLSDTFSM
jgi:hypothetical protein